MSATSATLSSEDYEERKRTLEQIKGLAKEEQKELFRILKDTRAEYSENSNGIFFDVCKLPAETFHSIQKFMEFCRKTREECAIREEEQRKAEEALHSY